MRSTRRAKGLEMPEAIAGLKRPRRQWWQIVCRWAVVVALVVAGAYVTLPWWAPKQYLRRELAAALSRQFGAAVRVGQLSLDWARGVEIQGLTIASGRADEAPVLFVERVRAELAPLNFLLRRRVGWLEMVKPRLSVRIGHDGGLDQVVSGRASAVTFGRVSIRQGAAALQFPDRQEEMAINIASLEFLYNPSNRQGSLTMVAALQEEGGEAPFTVRLASASGQEIVAFASMNFSNLDLQSLGLLKLLNLPLSKLQGLCSGSLDAQIDRRGMVNEFNLNILAANLDAQPQEGPQLPLVDKAGLGITASFDPFTGLVNIRDLRLRLPGAELAGQAEISADLYEGRLEALRSLDLRGQLQPASLTALITGQAGLPGRLQVDGPVDVHVISRCDDVRIALDLAAQANSATLRRDQELLKPAGTRLELEVKGTLDRRNWLFAAQEVELAVGDNRFGGKGTVQDLRSLLNISWPADGASVFKVILANLARVEWNGSWELRDCDSLKGFWPVLGEVDLRGAINGKWFIDHSGQPRLHVRVDVPPETHLALAANLAKPEAVAITADLAATIEPEKASLSDVDLDLAAGEGRCSLDGGLIAFQSEDQALRMTGRFEADAIESLLRCLRGTPLPVELTGKASGEFSARLAESADVLVRADFSALEVNSGDAFVKPQGQKAAAAANFRKEQGAQRWSVSLTADLEMGRVAGIVEFPESDSHTWRLKMQGDALSAERLSQAFPWLARRLEGGRLGGVVELAADVVLGRRQLNGTMSLKATGAEYLSAEAVPRRKATGVPLELDIKGGLSTDDAGRSSASVEKATIAFAGSRVELSGWAVLGGKESHSDGLAGGLVEAFQGSLDVDLALDDPLRAMLPEFSDAMTRNRLAGQLSLRAQAEGSNELISLRSQVDAEKLTFAVARQDRDGRANDPPGTLTMTKPAGLPAGAELDATIQGDLSRVDVGSLEAHIGALEMRAEGVIELEIAADGLPRDVIATKGRLSVGAGQAQELQQLMPWLKQYELSGAGYVDASWDGLGARLGRAELRLEQFSGLYRGRPLQLTGQVALVDIGRKADGDLRIGRLETDGLEFRAGSSHGWLVADLGGLPDGASGEFHLLAEYIDDKELVDWLAPHRAEATSPATPKDHRQALQEANDLLVLLRPYLLASDLKGRLSVDRYRTFDASVDQYYEAGFMTVDLSLAEGLFRADSFASINGGSTTAGYRIDLTEDSPQVVGRFSVRNLIASENIQPQLAKFFPGNTVYGTFDRTEESKAYLVDLLARAADPRYPVYPVGEAKTVAIDGLLKGRALPRFVARIFPGLNLTKYRYNKMTGFAELRGGGTVVNDMVFSGQAYDIYIEGTTDRDNIGRYEIGLILLGAPQTADWNHTYRQGRIPLLNFKARIEGGQMHDEKVRFVYPNESLFVIFLKNNLFYRLWLGTQKN